MRLDLNLCYLFLQHPEKQQPHIYNSYTTSSIGVGAWDRQALSLPNLISKKLAAADLPGRLLKTTVEV